MKNIILYILVPLSFFSNVVCGQQTNSRNYIISQTYKQGGANANDVSKVITQVKYLDGLGRPLQTVTVGQSPAGADIVQPIQLDGAGRQPKQFLPYIPASGKGAYQGPGISDAATWYSSASNPAELEKTGPSDVSRPYNESAFETSPLSRVINETGPGGKSTSSSIKYKTNCCGELKRYDYDKLNNTIVENGGYAPGTITYVFTTDEQQKQTKEYYDLLGRMICSQSVADPTPGPTNVTLSTYYVYDDIGLLRAVLQPKFQNEISLTNNAFTYDYDERGRMVAKHIPGGGKIEIVYDQYDRPALSRDANQLARNVWGFTKYDALNRPVISGEISNTDSRATWATKVNTGTQHHEERNNGVIAGYSLNLTAPITASEANLLSITFYDDYAFLKAAQLNYSAVYDPSNNANVKGQQTGGRFRMLPGDGTTGAWLTNVTYYDSEYRPIQTIRQLHDLGANAYERISTQFKYDLALVASAQKTEQAPSGTIANSHTATYTYDHADRILSVKEKVVIGANTKEAYTVAQRYTALGELKSKWFHSGNESEYRRRTDYTNNIRGWITDAVNVYKLKDNNPDLPFFAFSLDYANGGNYTNGNISTMSWKGKDEATFTKGLTFAYDGANRLLGSTGISNYKETESGIQYDLNGNLTKLIRKNAADVAIDNLTYNYTGNRLQSIVDAGTSVGVKTGTSTYIYDANGNMTTDGNRTVTITYNYLNLPKTIIVSGKNLRYDYDAGGTKHKYYAVAAADTINIKYAGRFEYDKNNAVKRVNITEGQVVPSGDTLRFDYFLKDHIGNVRVVFTELGDIIQKTDYYPFGLEIDRNTPVQTPAARNGINRYLFNGKESQVGTGYLDFGARMYMPEIGRWGTVDPMAEHGRRWSPYAYAFDNPMRFIDPDGMWPEDQRDDPFLIARLVTTAFYDTKHAIINTGARLFGSDIRAGYKADNEGNQTFETKIYRQSVDNSLGGVVSEVVNTVADVMLVATAGSSPANPGNLIAKTSKSQVVKAGKDVAQSASEIKISDVKSALRKVYDELGIPGSLPKGEKGKFGSPTAGDPKKGYRLDPAHPDRPKGNEETVPHINYWDWTGGKKDKGGKYGAVPLIDPK